MKWQLLTTVNSSLSKCPSLSTSLRSQICKSHTKLKTNILQLQINSTTVWRGYALDRSDISPFLTHPEVAWSWSKLAWLYHQREDHWQEPGSQKCPQISLFHQAGDNKKRWRQFDKLDFSFFFSCEMLFYSPWLPNVTQFLALKHLMKGC